MKNTVIVPPFDGKVKEPIERYAWWSWHPNYPYWSKSCWGGKTVEEAIAALTYPDGGGDRLDYYHNKLIREDDGGKLVEVLDRPCKRLDVWDKCIELNKTKKKK
jgi:hypothetical protein